MEDLWLLVSNQSTLISELSDGNAVASLLAARSHVVPKSHLQEVKPFFFSETFIVLSHFQKTKGDYERRRAPKI